jgi:hypothetical protein
MSPTAFSPEALQRMTDVYRRAVQELKLDRAPAQERDRLAIYIFSIGNTLDNPHRMLDRAVRMYLRTAPLDGLSISPQNNSATFHALERWATD